MTTTVPCEASFTYAMRGAAGSPEGGETPWTFSVSFTMVGAAAIAPTAAAPTAVLCKKLRLVIFDFLSSGIRIPLLWRRWGGTQTPYAAGPRHRPAAYFDVCNTACYSGPPSSSERRVRCRECRGGDSKPRPPGTPGAPRAAPRKKPISPTLHPAEPPPPGGPLTGGGKKKRGPPRHPRGGDKLPSPTLPFPAPQA